MSAVHEVDEQLLRELAELRAKQETTLSLYLDLDPSEFATGASRSSAVSSLLDSAHREIEGSDRPHTERRALRSALDWARSELEQERDWAQQARAIALFVDETLGLARTLRLGYEVETQMVIGSAPFIAPLVQIGLEDRLCVALVDERFARVLRGTPGRLREVISFGDPVHGRHDQGGWSQARYQRSREEDVKSHLRRVASVLHHELKAVPFDCLLVAATEVLWPALRAELHPDLLARLGERLQIDVADVTVEEVISAAERASGEIRRRREDEALRGLRVRAARPQEDAVALGLAEVLDALVQRRVEALLFDARLEAAGVRCPRCGWMAPEGNECPMDGAKLEGVENAVEAAAESAVRQSAETFALTDRPELASFGGIAATLRSGVGPG